MSAPAPVSVYTPCEYVAEPAMAGAPMSPVCWPAGSACDDWVTDVCEKTAVAAVPG